MPDLYPCTLRSWRAFVVALACGFSCLVTAQAEAAVRRFAVIIGNNHGYPHEVRLHHAQRDARRIYDVLTELGGVAREDALLLEGARVVAVRRALEATEAAIRRHRATGEQALLLVYYSGHADDRNLHLGAESYDLMTLREQMATSAADLRLVISDACRSSVLTRAKGGVPGPPFEIDVEGSLPGHGVVYIHAAGPGEASQESDQLEASFFSHYLVSGLRGAADVDGDMRVLLSEAFRYARNHTLRESSRGRAGAQHPAFQYDLSGERELVLTRLDRVPAAIGRLKLPPATAALVLSDHQHGPIVAELGFDDPSRELFLRAGRYFVRIRDRRRMYEGRVEIKAGQAYALRVDKLREARFLDDPTKGPHLPTNARVQQQHRIAAAYRLETSPWPKARPCHGASLQYEWYHPVIVVQSSVGWCAGEFAAKVHGIKTHTMTASIAVVHQFRLRRFSIFAGLAAGSELLAQWVSYTGPPPRPGIQIPPAAMEDQLRWVLGGSFGATLQFAWRLPREWSIRLWVDGRVRMFREQLRDESHRRVAFVFRPQFGIVKGF